MADSAADAGKDSVPDPTSAIQDKVKDAAKSDDDGKLIGPLKKVAVAAAVAALTPVIKDAVTNMAENAVKKAPEMLAGAGGAKGVVELAKNKLGGEGGGGMLGTLGSAAVGALGSGGGDDSGGGNAPDGTGGGRRMPVQQAVDVAAPIEIVYNQFTQFEDFPKFMHRVESVSQSDEGHVTFKSKLWGVNRQWEAEIIDQRPDERIAWKSASGVNLSGVATFHEIAPRLTRIEVNVDFDPEGFFEKIGRGMRFAKRSIRADLHRFKAYVEMQEEEDGEWRGYVLDGEAVEEEEYFGEEEGEEPVAEEEGEEEEQEPLAEEDEELLEDEQLEEEDLGEEPVAEEDLEEEDLEEEPVAEEELEEEEADEPAPASVRQTKSKSQASKNGGSKSASKSSGGSKSSRSRGSRSSSNDGGSASSSSARSSGGGKSSSAKKASSGGSGRSRSSGGGKSSSAKKASSGGSGRSRAKTGSTS